MEVQLIQRRLNIPAINVGFMSVIKKFVVSLNKPVEQ
jgi:hypothetical protein